MAQHTIVMTGATRGIGRIALDRIATLDPDAHLVLLARGETSSRLAAELTAAGRAASGIAVDLLSLAGTRQAADEVARRLDDGELPPLRGLVGNAGLQFTNDLTETAEGLEATFAINVLANHVLLRRLHDRFVSGSRITLTVSDTHFGDFRHNLGMVPGPSWQEPERLARIRAFPNPESVVAGRTAYSTSKLAAIHLIHEHARRLPDGVDIVGYNPGFVPGTDLTRAADALSRFAMRRIMPLMTLTPLATSKDAAGRYLADAALGRTRATSGAYINRGAEERSSAESYDPIRERQLWETAEELTRSLG
ncbi:SDR family NAD(P)-dependent oxidoreductase [Actinoalloteichus spitiensis]|uniref:SDR family NAD(P)-dependent oxidoreductase n=1 Tax=Actinoalloteichus spitiensis TaxID=252394 RepID=UPI0003610162|nr:SDR family NAD(P)-dependent oxidoreductase [Actinoalloteichus spitiensis]